MSKKVEYTNINPPTQKKKEKEKTKLESAVSMEMQMDKKIRTLRESYN